MNERPERPALRLVSDRVASWEWESFPRRPSEPRLRQRRLQNQGEGNDISSPKATPSVGHNPHQRE
jgi:hypothetical protein